MSSFFNLDFFSQCSFRKHIVLAKFKTTFLKKAKKDYKIKMVIWKVFLFQFWIYFWGSIHCVFSSISQKIHLFRIWRVVCLVSLSKVAKEKFVTILVQMTHASPCYILYLCVSSILQKVFIYYTNGSKNWGKNSAMMKKIWGFAVCTFIVKGLKNKSNF